MTNAVAKKIMAKLNTIELLQRKMRSEWQEFEDFFAESNAPLLRKQIHQERRAYQGGKHRPYATVRKDLGLA